MTRVVWTRQAVEDVAAIQGYVGRDSQQYASLLAEQIVASAGRLVSFPRSGRVVPEVGDESLREVIFGNYRVVYRLRDNVAAILTVCHAARILRT